MTRARCAALAVGSLLMAGVANADEPARLDLDARMKALELENQRLTNELMHGAFGMDVEGLRRYKRLTAANQHLRDHMSDLELALTALGETVAVTLCVPALVYVSVPVIAPVAGLTLRPSGRPVTL